MLIFNNIDFQEHFGMLGGMNRFIVNDVTGRGILTQETTRESVPGRNGSIVKSKRYPERPLGIQISFRSESLENMRKSIEELNALLMTDGEVPIVFKDEPDRTYFGMLDGSQDWEEIIYTGQGTINVLCSDPLKQGETNDFSFLESQTNEINVGGTAKTPAIMQAVVPSAVSQVDFTNGNETLRLNNSFSQNDIIVIDFEKEKVFINDTVSMTTVDILNSDFFKLNPGTNIIETNPAMQISGEYTERWL